jgi:hypothetical protein
MLSLEMRKAALPIEARLELLRRFDRAKALIAEAVELAEEEAATCAPLFAAAKKWEPIALASILISWVVAALAYYGDARFLAWVFILLGFVGFFVAQARERHLNAARTRLFQPRRLELYYPWMELGLEEPSLSGVSHCIVELADVWGWRGMVYPAATTEANLAIFHQEVEAALLDHIERNVKN